MSDSSLLVLPSASGSYVDNEAVTGHPDNAAEVLRQRIVIAGSELAELATPHNGPISPEAYGLAVRIVEERYRQTPFGETRVAAPYSLGDYVQTYGLDTKAMAKSETNGGTVTDEVVMSATRLTVADSGDIARQRTKRYHRYQPGHATMWRVTMNLDAEGVANRTDRWGQFDDNDGLYWEHSEGVTYVGIRSSVTGSPVEVPAFRIPQASWNVDPYNGSGRSGRTLNLANIHVFECAYQWLGAGLIWWFVDGHLVHVHEHPGANDVPYMATATLPLTWETISTGGAGWMRNQCSNVVSLGGVNPPSDPHSFSAPEVAVGTGGTPIMSIRMADLINGRANRAELFPVFASVLNEGSRGFLKAVLNPTTLTDADWAATPPAGSSVDIDTAATAIVGGTDIGQVGVESNGTNELDLEKLIGAPHRSHRALRRGAFDHADDAAADVLTLVGVDAQGGTTDMTVGLNWHEVR